MVGTEAPPPSSSSPVLGRDEILLEVDRRIGLAQEGHGQGVILVGPGGSGKTRVLRSIVGSRSARGCRILSGRAPPDELPPPFSLIRSVLGPGETDEREIPPIARWGDRTPLLSESLHEELSDRPRSAPQSSAPTEAQQELDRILASHRPRTAEGLAAGRENLLGRIGEYFRGLARERPLLLVIDDLHLADTASLEFLWRFALDLPEISAVVVGTVGADTEIPDRNRISIERLHRSSVFHSHLLLPLTVPEVTRFASWILGGQIPDPKDVLRWHAQTEGNPLFVEQLVRAASGVAALDRGGGVGEGRDLTELLIARFRELEESAQRILTYAAVVGKEFAIVDLVAVAGTEEERVAESLDRLVQCGLIREKGNEIYEFVSEAVRANVYAHLTETRRRILHRKAGLAIEARGGVRDAELARQFYLGRENDRAVKYNVLAAEEALRSFSAETAVTYLARALEAERRRPERDLPTEVRFLIDQGQLLTELDRLDRSEEVLTEAIELTRSRADLDHELGRAQLGLAQTRHQRGAYPEAARLAAEAMTHLGNSGTKREQMVCRHLLGEVHLRLGDLSKAEEHQRAALEIAEGEGTPLDRAKALVDVANVMLTSGPTRFEEALGLYSRAADLASQGEDHVGRARVLMNRGVLEWSAGRTDEAFRDLGLAVEAAERSHSPRWIGYCTINLAQLQAELGRVEKARPLLARTIRAFAPIGDGFVEQQIQMTRGMIAHADRAFEQAQLNYLESYNLARSLQLPSETAEVLFRLAQLALDRGEPAQARVWLSDSRSRGLLEHRPDFAPRVAALEASLAGTVGPESPPPPDG